MRDRPLNIMNLISHDGRGGADRLALDLSKGLKRLGHRVIWGSPSHCYLIEEARKAELEIYDLYPSGSIEMKGLPAFMQFCKKEDIDILNAHHSHSRHMLLLARLRGLTTKIVFTRHCILKTVPYLGAFFYNFTVDMNIAVSNIVRKSLLRSGILPGKAVTIYGGTDVEKFEKVSSDTIERIREQYTCPGSFTIGMVARLQHRGKFSPDKPTLKGHEVLFRAVAALNGDINLLLLGPWNEGDIEKLKLIAQCNGLNTNMITFCGFQDDIAPFYKIMDLHVLPSPNEGLGLGIIEAMAAGVPCIGADIGGIREIISNGIDGFLVRPGNSRDLAEKIRILFENKEKRDLFIINGKKKVKKLFNIEKTVNETEKIFYDLLN